MRDEFAPNYIHYVLTGSKMKGEPKEESNQVGLALTGVDVDGRHLVDGQSPGGKSPLVSGLNMWRSLALSVIY